MTSALRLRHIMVVTAVMVPATVSRIFWFLWNCGSFQPSSPLRTTTSNDHRVTLFKNKHEEASHAHDALWEQTERKDSRLFDAACSRWEGFAGALPRCSVQLLFCLWVAAEAEPTSVWNERGAATPGWDSSRKFWWCVKVWDPRAADLETAAAVSS